MDIAGLPETQPQLGCAEKKQDLWQLLQEKATFQAPFSSN